MLSSMHKNRKASTNHFRRFQLNTHTHTNARRNARDQAAYDIGTAVLPPLTQANDNKRRLWPCFHCTGWQHGGGYGASRNWILVLLWYYHGMTSSSFVLHFQPWRTKVLENQGKAWTAWETHWKPICKLMKNIEQLWKPQKTVEKLYNT